MDEDVDIEDNLEENIKNFARLTAELQWITLLKIEDEDKKMSLIEQIEDEVERAYLIQCTVFRDEDKIRLIKNLTNRRAILIIISTLQNEELKKEFIENTLDENEKVYILDTIQHSKDKSWIMEQSEKIKSPISRAYLIGNMKNYESMQIKVETIQDLVTELIDVKNCEKGKYERIGIDPKITVGIEIEAEGMWSQLINNYEREIWDWKVEEDMSLIGGVEIISPVFKDDKICVSEIYQILTMMNKLGLETNKRCGGHVHIGANYLENIEQYKEFFEIYGNAEKIIYLIANKPEELPRKSAKDYAGPISVKWKEKNSKYKEPTKKDEFIKIAKEIQVKAKEYSLNIRNVGSENKDTIEFRASNGTLDGDIWVENIKLYARIMQTAKEIAKIKEKHKNGEEITDDEQAKIIAKYKLKHTNSDDEKMSSLMELLFDEDEREVYLERYNKNKELAEKTHFFDDWKFGKVDCKKIFKKPEQPEQPDNER